MKDKKRAYGEGRKQVNLRLPPELTERVDQLAKELGKSRTQYIVDAVWSYTLGTQNFALCPTCQAACFVKEEIPLAEGISEIECINGHAHNYDFEEDKFITA